MRVRCTFCGADYEAPVTPAALALVGRCEYCRRERLESAEEAPPPADEAVRRDERFLGPRPSGGAAPRPSES